MASQEEPSITIEVDGNPLSCSQEGTLLDALRDDGGFLSVKDGCSPQGQCGCCTVLIDGVARVSCVTPIRRVVGRKVTTINGVDPELRERLIQAFDSTAASQCGFCTPGILVRLCALARKGIPSDAQVRTVLGAHLCRCTGFQPIVDAAIRALTPEAPLGEPRDQDLANQRATLESGTAQHIGRDVTLGTLGFAIDSAPPGCLVGVASADGGYVLAGNNRTARAQLAKVQGRNSTIPLRAPIPLPVIEDSVLELRTTFVEPAYVEPDSSWCLPDGEPALPFANAGAFGAKRNSPIRDDVFKKANETGQGILLTWPREEVVARGAKRPPLALALREDGTGMLRIGRTPNSDPFDGLMDQIHQQFPDLVIEVVEVVGPRIGVTHRGAVVAEVLAAYAALGTNAGELITVTTVNGASAAVRIRPDQSMEVEVNAGKPLCESTLASYVIGAVHQGLGMVRSEGIAVNDEGLVQDLTIRSFGILSASQMPHVAVLIVDDEREPIASGVAVMSATMAACWLETGLSSHWPTNREVIP